MEQELLTEKDASLAAGGDPAATLRALDASVVAGKIEQDQADEAKKLIQVGPLDAPPRPLLQAELSGTSRLAFRVKKDVAEIPRTLEDLLNWGRYFDPVPSTSPGDDPHTEIEIPTRLMLTPEDSSIAWEHVGSVDNDGVSVLWHTRLVDPSHPGSLNFHDRVEEWQRLQFDSLGRNAQEHCQQHEGLGHAAYRGKTTDALRARRMAGREPL